MSLLPQFGFIELMVIAVVALIVVGPKELPVLLRSFGKAVAKARSMAAEFTSAFDDMAREAEMEELRQEMEAMRFEDMADEVREEVDEAFKPVSDEINQTIKSGEEDGLSHDKAVTDETVSNKPKVGS